MRTYKKHDILEKLKGRILSFPSGFRLLRDACVSVGPREGGRMMDAFVEYNAIFIAGVALMAAAAVGGIAALAAFRISGKRLRAKLEAEFGKKRR